MADEWSEKALLSEALDDKIVIEVGSSFIDVIAYDLKTKIMVVSFVNGDPVTYFDKTFEEFKDFVNSRSKGSHYNRYIRGR